MNFVSFIRFVAAVLITNSHFDELYPAGFSWMSTGGALGNALFFFVSGWTLYLSRRSNFAEWIARRYSRIFPSAWIFYLCVIAAGAGTYAAADFLTLSSHWFLNAIVVFYPAFFFITKFFEKRLPWIIALTAIPLAATFFALPHESYILESGTLNLRWYAYFAIMLLGAFAARNRETLFGGNAPAKRKRIILEMGGGGYNVPRRALFGAVGDAAFRRSRNSVGGSDFSRGRDILFFLRRAGALSGGCVPGVFAKTDCGAFRSDTGNLPCAISDYRLLRGFSVPGGFSRCGGADCFIGVRAQSRCRDAAGNFLRFCGRSHAAAKMIFEPKFAFAL